MKRFHFERKEVCVAVADLPLHIKEYTPEQIRKYSELFQKELMRSQIYWRYIDYDREEDALFAYTDGDWECKEN